MYHVQAQPKHDNLVDMFIDPKTGAFRTGTLTLGARVDSYYEYLLKQWLQTNRTEPRLERTSTMRRIHSKIFFEILELIFLFSR